MGVPFIKIYALPAGYSETGDTDIQSASNDELLPVVDRSQLLQDAVALTGIVPYLEESLQPVDLVIGRDTYDLTSPGATTQTPVGIAVGDIVDARGYLGIVVYDGLGDPVDEENWTFDEDGFTFASGFEPVSGWVSCFVKHSLPHTAWALARDTPYGGANQSFNTIVVRVDGGQTELATTADVNTAHIVTSSADEVLATYAVTLTNTKWFIGEYNNWITDHLRMNPDVFVGEIDYPGDATEVDDVPYEPGLLPQFREIGTYTIDARRGMVGFPEDIDSETDVVKALYAHLYQIDNVTGQRLDVVPMTGGLSYRATAETAFPASHGKRWVRQVRDALPMSVYLNGEAVPQITTTIPYDQLTVITGE